MESTAGFPPLVAHTVLELDIWAKRLIYVPRTSEYLQKRTQFERPTRNTFILIPLLTIGSKLDD